MGGENGTVLPGTPIAVDMWSVRKHSQARVFFLTHMHADHTKGLTSSWNLPIHCSPISKRLLIHKFKIQERLIRVLEVGRSHVIYLDDQNEETMSVDVIDANHCPGAVMYLFQGYFGRILYTGDFRFREEMFEDAPLSVVEGVDVLHLDNTYCAPHCTFPTQHEALQRIIDVIERHPGHVVLIGIRTLGKENVLVALARYFETWVVVTPTCFATLHVLEMPNVFSDNPDAGFIHAVPFHSVTRSLLAEWNEDRPTLAILPTALFAGLDWDPYCNQPDIHLVPYSDHSSYTELHEFVSRVKPRSIIPIVKEKGGRGMFRDSEHDRSDMQCFGRHLNPTPRAPVSIPPSVQRYMYRGSALNIPNIVPLKRKRSSGQRPTPPARRRKARGAVFETPPDEECHVVQDEKDNVSSRGQKGHVMQDNNDETCDQEDHVSEGQEDHVFEGQEGHVSSSDHEGLESAIPDSRQKTEEEKNKPVDTAPRKGNLIFKEHAEDDLKLERWRRPLEGVVRDKRRPLPASLLPRRGRRQASILGYLATENGADRDPKWLNATHVSSPHPAKSDLKLSRGEKTLFTSRQSKTTGADGDVTRRRVSSTSGECDQCDDVSNDVTETLEVIQTRENSKTVEKGVAKKHPGNSFGTPTRMLPMEWNQDEGFPNSDEGRSLGDAKDCSLTNKTMNESGWSSALIGCCDHSDEDCPFCDSSAGPELSRVPIGSCSQTCSQSQHTDTETRNQPAVRKEESVMTSRCPSQKETRSDQCSSQRETRSEQYSSQRETISEQYSSQRQTRSEQYSSQRETRNDQSSPQRETRNDQSSPQRETRNDQCSSQKENQNDQCSLQKETRSDQCSSQRQARNEKCSPQKETRSDLCPQRETQANRRLPGTGNDISPPLPPPFRTRDPDLDAVEDLIVQEAERIRNRPTVAPSAYVPRRISLVKARGKRKSTSGERKSISGERKSTSGAPE